MDNISVTNNNNNNMFKITLESKWNKNGIPTNYVKYLKVNTIEEVWNYFTLTEVKEIEEC